MNKSKYVHALNVLHFAAIVHPTPVGYVAISRKDGSLLQVVEGELDRTLELGGSVPVSGDPIAKEQRLFTLDKDGQVKKHALYEERVKKAEKLLDENKIARSVSALKKLKYEFNDDLSIKSEPAPVEAPEAAPEVPPQA